MMIAHGRCSGQLVQDIFYFAMQAVRARTQRGAGAIPYTTLGGNTEALCVLARQSGHETARAGSLATRILRRPVVPAISQNKEKVCD
jgi:hypothetical protein